MGNLAFGTNGSSYYDWAKQGRIYCAFASITAPVIYSTAAGTGGPLLWNNSMANGGTPVNAVILAVSADLTVASTVASTLGLTGNSGQVNAPGTTTAITAKACTNIGGPYSVPACNVYNIGTPTNAGNFFMPTHTLDTGALTTGSILPAWVDIGGLFIASPGDWISVAASVTASTAVCKVGLVWVEIPIA